MEADEANATAAERGTATTVEMEVVEDEVRFLMAIMFLDAGFQHWEGFKFIYPIRFVLLGWPRWVIMLIIVCYRFSF